MVGYGVPTATVQRTTAGHYEINVGHVHMVFPSEHDMLHGNGLVDGAIPLLANADSTDASLMFWKITRLLCAVRVFITANVCLELAYFRGDNAKGIGVEHETIIVHQRRLPYKRIWLAIPLLLNTTQTGLTTETSEPE